MNKCLKVVRDYKSDLSDGVYNLRTGFVGAHAYDYFYHDEVLITVHGGKASIKLLPTNVALVLVDVQACTLVFISSH